MPAPRVEGFGESLEWAADGKQLMMVVAGSGADLAGAQGGFNPNASKQEAADWAPEVDTGPSDEQWRRAWVLNIASGQAKPVSTEKVNVWEAAWCGESSIAAITSDGPDEAAWYRAKVEMIDVHSGENSTLYTPKHHLGWICSNPSGSAVAVVEAICSDRTVVAGDIVLLSTQGDAPRRLDAAGVDVSALRFIDEGRLMFAGHRSFETVLGVIDLAEGKVRVLWSSSEQTFGNARYPEFALMSGERVFALAEGFTKRPTLSVIDAKGLRQIALLGNPTLAAEVESMVESVEALRWRAPDGLEIHGWLI